MDGAADRECLLARNLNDSCKRHRFEKPVPAQLRYATWPNPSLQVTVREGHRRIRRPCTIAGCSVDMLVNYVRKFAKSLPDPSGLSNVGKRSTDVN
jgi:hypothetical protein